MNDITGLHEEYERDLYLMEVNAGRAEYFGEDDRPFILTDQGRQAIASASTSPLAASETLFDAWTTYNAENARLDHLIGKILTGDQDEDAIDRQTQMVITAWRAYVDAARSAPPPNQYVSALIDLHYRQHPAGLESEL